MSIWKAVEIRERDAHRFGGIDTIRNRHKKTRGADRVLGVTADDTQIGDHLALAWLDYTAAGDQGNLRRSRTSAFKLFPTSCEAGTKRLGRERARPDISTVEDPRANHLCGIAGIDLTCSRESSVTGAPQIGAP